jgi:predicted RNA-binding Zn ribbon-like protein
MMTMVAQPHPFPVLANAAWLDLINTEVVAGGRRLDLLTDPAALLRWGHEAGLLDPEERAQLARSEPAGGVAALDAARRLRAGLGDAAVALAAGEPPAPALVAEINALLAAQPVTQSLRRADGGWTAELVPVQLSAWTLLARVAADFARFLTGAVPGDLRRCARPDCVLYFLDTSKNHSRRWCSMDACGNREKAASRRARARA